MIEFFQKDFGMQKQMMAKILYYVLRPDWKWMILKISFENKNVIQNVWDFLASVEYKKRCFVFILPFSMQ